MTAEEFLPLVKDALGITGEYQDKTVRSYIEETMEYLEDAGVQRACITPGIVSRGVSDLWRYGAGEARFSEYFIQRAVQLAYKSPCGIQGEEGINDKELKEIKEMTAEIHEAVVTKQEV